MGVHEESGFLSIYLVNKSEREVFASYKLTLKNQGIGEDLVWVDPEKLVSFSGANTGDNMWGNDEVRGQIGVLVPYDLVLVL